MTRASYSDLPKLRPNRVRSAAAVNATRAFFEANGCVFHEVAEQNDYGKDAFVELGLEGRVTGLCAALQIKGGESYERPDGGYVIPIGNHAEYWRSSSIPIFGIVHDSQDDGLRWCNISEMLGRCRRQPPTSLYVEGSAVLTPMALRREIAAAVETARFARTHHALMRLLSPIDQVSFSAIHECFIAGRSDPEVLITLRYVMPALTVRPLCAAIETLSRLTDHPDILWHPGNWIPEEVAAEVRRHFRWSTEEVATFLEWLPLETFQRGCTGESLYMLLIQDPNIKATMRRACTLALERAVPQAIWTALHLWLFWERDGARDAYEKFVAAHPEIRNVDNVDEIEAQIHSGERLHIMLCG